jgi:formate hydrogenlyase subunit 6/NADH:ubiquinone oxidoreductase subunit I
LGTYHEEDIEIVGDRLESFRVRDFEVKREPIKAYKSKGTLNLLRNSFIPKPYIIESKCVKCGVCINMCPVNPKAVDWHDGDKKKTPSYKYNRCIRCYCCQELCPESAIYLKVPLIRKLLNLSN